MKSLSLANMLDDQFFELGAFTSLDDGARFIFGKGGFCSEKKIESVNPYFYIKEFYHSEFIYYYPEVLLTSERDQVTSEVERFLSDEEFEKQSTNYDDIFIQDFQQLKDSLGQHFKKAVLISSEWIDVKNRLKATKNTFAKSIMSKAGTPYGLWNKDYSVIGITPEILYERKGREIQTLALAGTAKRGEEAVLLSSKKDRLEHDIVVIHILEELKSLGQHVEVSETRISGFGSLIHLKTPIKAQLNKEVNDSEIIKQLSPTAALGGYPKSDAMTFLQGTKYYAKFPKRFFGSVFGIQLVDRHLALVMIRNIQFKENSLIIETGAGIVSESDLAKELHEIVIKREAIKELLL